MSGRRAAIAGIGATEFSKSSGRSELQLAAEAVRAALVDCGIGVADVEGLVTFTLDSSPEHEVAANLGMGDLSFFSRVPFGGGAGGGCLLHAAMAVEAGVADVVVIYRAFNERSGHRFGLGTQTVMPVGPVDLAGFSFYSSAGLVTASHWGALTARRYMHQYGATSEDFGRVVVQARDFAATNPAAFYYERPVSLQEHQESPWTVKPIRRLDCCQETDGGVALVVTTVDRARDLAHPPAVIEAAAQGLAEGESLMTSFYRDDIAGIPSMDIVARQLWERSALGPDDVQLAILYDHFTPFVLMQLEACGFCKPGEAREMLGEGITARGGRLPVNTHGGQLGEAYLHGMNGIAEAVRQIRGTASNQVDDVEHVLVTAGTGLPTSGAVLGSDR